MGYGLAIAAIIGAVGSYAASSKSADASKEASAAMNQVHQVHLDQIPYPELVDWRNAVEGAVAFNSKNLQNDFNLGSRVNLFNLNQALRNYSRIQPFFQQNQNLIGRNVASFARGELPSDVVNSIGRAAAQRGIEGGFGMGLNAGGTGGALSSLNLRNLGLTSLQLSQSGTQMAMDANRSAAAMSPQLFDPTSMFVSPALAVGSQFQNANILNNWNAQNTQIRNAQATGNTELLNNILQTQIGMQYQGSLQSAQQIAQGANQLGNIINQYASSQANNSANAGQYGQTYAATQASAPQNQVTYTPGVGYAVVPKTVA